MLYYPCRDQRGTH
ncbi:hypothetical protein LINPERPRIM_LOCUS2591 [Linum perenne]